VPSGANSSRTELGLNRENDASAKDIEERMHEAADTTGKETLIPLEQI